MLFGLPSLLIQHAPLIVILALQILSLPGLLSSQTILLCAGSYYVVAAPTTAADNAKVGWVYTVNSTFWTGLGTLSGTADKFPGYWEYFPIGYGPFQMSVRATPK